MQTGRILVADDNPLIRASLANLLDKWGMRFTMCEDGLQAWEHLQKNQYDMLLVDLQMPKMDGYQVVTKLRKNRRNINNSIPIVAIAGSADKVLIDQIQKAGVSKHMLKPFEPGALFKAISSLSKIPNHHKVRFFSDELDNATLDSLYDGDRDHMMMMFKLFLKSTPTIMHEMKNAMREGNLENLERAIHKIKPTFSMVGLKKITHHAQQFEVKMRAAKRVGSLNAEYRRFSTSVDKAMKVIKIEQRNLQLSARK